MIEQINSTKKTCLTLSDNVGSFVGHVITQPIVAGQKFMMSMSVHSSHWDRRSLIGASPSATDAPSTESKWRGPSVFQSGTSKGSSCSLTRHGRDGQRLRRKDKEGDMFHHLVISSIVLPADTWALDRTSRWRTSGTKSSG